MTQSPVLETYQWTQRVLLLFTPNSDHEAYKTQQTLLQDVSAGLLERDLTVLRIVGDELHGAAPGVLASDTLRRSYSVAAADFLLVLIGKDGTVKRRSHEVVTPTELFSQIDSMPMRQRELRDG